MRMPGGVCKTLTCCTVAPCSHSVAELELAHLFVVLCTHDKEVWDTGLTYQGDDFSAESELGYQKGVG